MALIRGEKGLYPCPICLVPRSQQSDLSTFHTLRTADHTKSIYEAGLTLTAADREELLKSEGLRNVVVCSKPIMVIILTIALVYTMPSGWCSSQILMLPYLGITCTTMHMVWVVNIYGQKFNAILKSWVVMHQKELMIS